MFLFQIVKKNESYEHWALEGKVTVEDDIYFIVAKDNHQALMATIEKTKYKVQDLTINKVCKVGEIMGAHFTPVDF